MQTKNIALSLILMGLIALGAVCVGTVKAQTQDTITINQDGSITPSTAPIQQTGNAYSLTSNLRGSITVNKNNTLLEGNGYTVFSKGNYESGAVELKSVTNVTVEGFIIPFNSEQTIGISLIDTSNAIVINNTVKEFESIQAWNGGSFTGISISGGNSNIITKNTLINNLNGLMVYGSSYNQISENNVTSKTSLSGLYSHGICFNTAFNNSFYHNNIINNTYQFWSSNSVNFWDDGYPNGGNYWSDYTAKNPNADARSKLGIYNLPYVIDPQNRDHYPLVKHFNSADYALLTVPPKVSILSPLNLAYNESDLPLVFTVDKAVNWEAYSLDGKQNTTVTGNSTIANVTNGFHNLTLYANDTYGDIGASTTTFTMEKQEPFPIVTVAAALGVIAIIVGVGLAVYFKKNRH
jgi:parallel beta-helix repeat protein